MMHPLLTGMSKVDVIHLMPATSHYLSVDHNWSLSPQRRSGPQHKKVHSSVYPLLKLGQMNPTPVSQR